MAPKSKIVDTDCLIIGAGLAGAAYALFAASRGVSCTIIAAGKGMSKANSDWAQGGIIYEPNRHSPSLRKDIITASGKTANPRAVNRLVRHGADIIESFLLKELNVSFDRDAGGNLKLTREGGHSEPRIIYAKDRTGHAILDAVYKKLLKIPNIGLLANRLAVDLLTLSHHSRKIQDKYEPLTCCGAYVLNRDTQSVEIYRAKKTILATGGLGRIFERTTNQPGIVGGGIAMAYRMGARVMDLEYTQFHPTVFHKKGCPPFLISEAVRGEGGILINEAGKAFMDDIHPQGSLAPRDIIARAIHQELFEHDQPCVYIDLSKLDPNFVVDRFPNITAKCASYGVEIARDPIPVSPAAHYLCGGIFTDLFGRTTIRHLNAIGETACTGLHGANRLASTSLLECLVSANAAAEKDAKDIKNRQFKLPDINPWKDRDQKADPVLIEQDLHLIRRTLWNYAGIVRSRKRLERAKKVLWEIKEAVDETYRTHHLTRGLLELRDAAQTGLLVVYAASRNPTSAGCHTIIDD